MDIMALTLLIDLETWWRGPICGGVCQDAYTVMVIKCIGSGCGTAVLVNSESFRNVKSVQAPTHVTLLIVEL